MAPAVNTCTGQRGVGQVAPESAATSCAYLPSSPRSPSAPYAATLWGAPQRRQRHLDLRHPKMSFRLLAGCCPPSPAARPTRTLQSCWAPYNIGSTIPVWRHPKLALRAPGGCLPSCPCSPSDLYAKTLLRTLQQWLQPKTPCRVLASLALIWSATEHQLFNSLGLATKHSCMCRRCHSQGRQLRWAAGWTSVKGACTFWQGGRSGQGHQLCDVTDESAFAPGLQRLQVL